MEKLVFITGQLITEIRTRLGSVEGSRRMVDGTAIVPGGRSYRQALFAKREGYGVILLGRLGDDHFGETILRSLSGLGVSTQFIETAHGEYTGLSFEVTESTVSAPVVYLDPGASIGPADFSLPIQRYLPLCDAVLINQWIHPDICIRIARQAREHRVPTVYVCSAPPQEWGELSVDYLFVDRSERPDGLSAGWEEQGGQSRRGTYVWEGGRLQTVGRETQEVPGLETEPDMNGDLVVTRLMGRIIKGRERDESALRADGQRRGG